MDNISNISKTFSKAKEELALPLKEIGKVVADLKEKHGDIPEAVIMCETIYNNLRSWWEKAAGADPEPFGIGFDFQGDLGIDVYYVDDETAMLIPELGTENILIGSRLDIWKLTQYIIFLKEKGGKE